MRSWKTGILMQSDASTNGTLVNFEVSVPSEINGSALVAIHYYPKVYSGGGITAGEILLDLYGTVNTSTLEVEK